MNEVQIFQFENHNIRTVQDEDGTIWWSGLDVGKALGMKKPQNAYRRVSEKNKKESRFEGSSQRQVIVNEAGLYSLVFAGKTEAAERFTDWVTSVVLPSIRKTGSYSVPAVKIKALTPAQQFLQSAQALVALEEKQLQIESTVQKQDNRLIEIESRVLGSQNGQPLSALGYLRINGHSSDSSTVLKFGMKASKMAKELGITAFKVSDPRYGSVNAFYAEFFDQVAEEFFNATAI